MLRPAGPPRCCTRSCSDMTPLVALVLVLVASSHATVVRRRCITPPCDYASLDVDGVLRETIPYDSEGRSTRSVHQPRGLFGLLGELAPVAAATSGLLAGVANLGFAANHPYYNPYYDNPWYGGYGGYAPGFGYGYPYAPYRPFL